MTPCWDIYKEPLPLLSYMNPNKAIGSNNETRIQSSAALAQAKSSKSSARWPIGCSGRAFVASMPRAAPMYASNSSTCTRRPLCLCAPHV